MKSLFEQMREKISPKVKRYVQKQGDIAVQIAEILKKKNIKQKDLAKMLNMKESQLSKILSGNVNLTIKTIAKIETVLGDDIIQVPYFSKKSEDTPCIVMDCYSAKNNVTEIEESLFLVTENTKFSTLKGKENFSLKINLSKEPSFISSGNA